MSLSKAEQLIQYEFQKRTGELDLSNLGLKQIPPAIQSLFWLTELELSTNKISRIEHLERLTELKHLNLSNNPLEHLDGLPGFSKLRYLYLNHIGIRRLPNFDGLPALHLLSLNGNDLEVIEGLEPLTTLVWLHLNSNRIKCISGLQTLTRLISLDLGDNLIREVSGVHHLERLKTLSIAGNPIEDLAGVVPLIKENIGLAINFRNCPIKNPRIEVIREGNKAIIAHYELTKKETVPHDQIKLIFLGNSSCGKTSLSRFMYDKGHDPYEVSTHGIRQVPWIPASINQTELANFQCNLWDFGGQHYYHATHRLFLSRNAIYVIVCNADKEHYNKVPTLIHQQRSATASSSMKDIEHFQYPYWLNTIYYYAAASLLTRPIPVFLIENKHAGKPEVLGDLVLDTNFKTRFANFDFHGFYKLDVREAWGYEQKSQTNLTGITDDESYYHQLYQLWHAELLRVVKKEIAGSKMPPKYPLIREWINFRANHHDLTHLPVSLSEMLDGMAIELPDELPPLSPWITYASYEALIDECLTPDDTAEIGYEQYLVNLNIYLQHSCGRILHFPKHPAGGIAGNLSYEQSTDGWVCIDPQWLHDRIYEVLDPNVLEAQSRFDLAHIAANIHTRLISPAQLVNVLRSFDLIFEVPDTPVMEFIAPQALSSALSPTEQVQLEEHKQLIGLKLALTITFPYFLPGDLLARFIAKKGHHAMRGLHLFWKYGILYRELMEKNELTVLVQGLPATNEVKVYLPENTPGRIREHYLRNFVQVFIEQICEDFPLLQLRIPANPISFSWEHLCKNNLRQEAYSETSGLYADIAGFEFLLPPKMGPKINIFVSYAHAQRKEAQIFNQLLSRALKTKQSKYNLEIFDDQEIPVGEVWHSYLQGKIEDCDILICLVSQDFLNSDYIAQHELGLAKVRLKNGAPIELFPIYFERYDPGVTLDLEGVQHYRPAGERYGKKRLGQDFSFADLVGNTPTAYQKQQWNYVLDMVKEKLQPMIDVVLRQKRLQSTQSTKGKRSAGR